MKYKTIMLLIGLVLLTGCSFNSEIKKNSTDILERHEETLLTVEAGNKDCVSMLLALYADNTYELFTAYHACRPNETCTLKLVYTKSIKGRYDYDINKIIKESTDANDMTFAMDNLPEYELRDKFDHSYVVEKGKENKYLNELLEQLDVNLNQCAFKDYDSIITTKKYNDFKLEFEDKKCNSKEKVIHTFNDGRKIYSRCGNIYYVSGDDKKPLSAALNNNDIQVTDITSRMEVTLGVYDGSTTVYEYRPENLGLGDNSFKFEKCNATNGSKDMLFLSSKSDNYKCA